MMEVINEYVFSVFFVETLLNGLLYGGVLALLSLGLNLIFGVIDVVWICYAELVMLGMYTIYFMHVRYGIPLIPSSVICVVMVALLGYVLHRIIIAHVLYVPAILTSTGLFTIKHVNAFLNFFWSVM